MLVSLLVPGSYTVSLSPSGLRIELVLNWGDFHYMGLTGLEVVGQDGERLPVDIIMMTASPRDLNDLPEYGDDLHTLDKCVSEFITFSCLRYHIYPCEQM